MKLLRVLILLIVFVSSMTMDLFGQYFGRNKVQYESKEWEYIQSKHFDLYYYEGGQKLAEFAAVVAETSFVMLNKIFNYELIDRIPFIIYRSHNDFTETNTSYGIVGESVGGFTEFFKNRIVIPFDGSYEQFRHVIHHELTHAVMLQFLYGAGPGSIIKGISRMTPPLWFIEGLAEYTSIGWDTESDMYVRDASVRGYLPPLQYLSGFLVYKGGQSLLKYIEEIYGPQKLTEQLQRMRTSRSFEDAWERTLNETIEETNKKWQRWVRKQYWPDIANRKEPFDYAQPLTDNLKWENFVNNSPAVSPAGDKVAFLTDRSGYFDIYMISATDTKDITKLISGQRKADLEELQWLRPGMSWSPDGKYIAFTSRSAGEDAINILDVDDRKITKSYKFKMDGIFSPDWSPVANEIVFVGVRNCSSDIYVYNMDKDELSQLTRDSYSDMEPVWSPDGKVIAFASDRKDDVEIPDAIKCVDMAFHDYHTTDIYLINRPGERMQRLTDSDMNENYPQWSPDGNKLLYVSDMSGIANIYFRDMTTGKVRALTNLLSGCAQLSYGVNSNRLAFTAFSNAGYNIYIWPDPFQAVGDTLPEPQPTQYVLNSRRDRSTLNEDEVRVDREQIKDTVRKDQDFSRYIFGENFSRGIIDDYSGRAEQVKLTESETREDSGEFKTNKYRPQFSLDNAGMNAGYDPIFGFYGLTQLSISDILGNHQLVIGANIIRDFENSDFMLSYQFLKNRLDWGLFGYQYVNFYATTFGTVRFVNRGTGFFTSYPFSRFRRIDAGLQFFNIKEDFLSFQSFEIDNFSILMPSLSYTKDNTIWGFTGPADGNRFYIGVNASPKVGNNGKEFMTSYFDYRRYYQLGRDYTLAFRLTSGASFGKNPTLFIMGGVDNWLNYRFNDKIDVISIPEYFLSNWVTPLRAANLYQMVGTRAALFNLEVRFPFIQYLITKFPLELGFSNIQGLGFIDAGSAWTDESKWKFTDRDENGERYVRDVMTGFGYGIRAYVYLFVLKFDAAWRTDFNKVSSPYYYWSIGLDF
ncbi:PD40 domain-containing protein [candidate division KSB1 bacterium]|nr:PD40 domain-containing protein [candidate division KSB1 bacterium]